MAIHKGGPIIRQHHFGYAKPTCYVFFDEVGHCCPICISHRYSLYPLGTNFNRCKYPSMAFGLLRYRTYQVKCTSVKQVRGLDVVQFNRQCMYQVPKFLAGLTSPYEVFSIFFHCWPVVTEVNKVPIQSLHSLMFYLVGFSQYFVCLVL